MSDTIADLKRKLTELGISTATPGLVGEDRREELQYRYDVAQSQIQSSINNNGKDRQDNNSASAVPNSNSSENESGIPSLSQLSISEIKSRLAALGENTNTPGLAGEERKTELMKRLVKAICISDSEKSDEILDSIVDNVDVQEAASTGSSPEKSARDAPSNYIDKAPDLDSFQEKKAESPAAEPAKPVRVIVVPPPPARKPAVPEPVMQEKEVLTAAQISELKKELKRLSNKRALVIAERISGRKQDTILSTWETQLKNIDAEVNRLKKTKVPATAALSKDTCLDKFSSYLIDNGQQSSFDRLMARLEKLKNETKDQVSLSFMYTFISPIIFLFFVCFYIFLFLHCE